MSSIKREIQNNITNEEDANEFAEVLGKPVARLSNIPKRITLNSTTYELKNKAKNVIIIYKAIIQSLKLEWFHSLANSSKYSNKKNLSDFIAWLEFRYISSHDKYEILNLFQTDRIERMMLKPQSVGLPIIINHINAGMACGDLEYAEIEYLGGLCAATKIAEIVSREPKTLSSFFTSIAWLKQFMDQSDYRKLESPKILIDSFSVAVATTLLEILKEKRLILEFLKKLNSIDMGQTKKVTARKGKYRFAEKVLFEFAHMKDSQPCDLLTELLIGDFVGKSKIDHFFRLTHNIKSGVPLKTKQLEIFNYPGIFSPCDLPSKLEQVLFAWLCSTLAIPVSSIREINSGNFVVNRTSRRHLQSVHVKYFKSRSGSWKESPILSGNDVEAKSIAKYLEIYGEEKRLVTTKLAIGATFQSHQSVMTKLYRVWSGSHMVSKVKSELAKRRSSKIFLLVFIALAKHSEQGIANWTYQHRDPISGKNPKKLDYVNAVPHPLPTFMFGLSAIKTSAVYARTDMYRDEDLVNYNGHSSSTEKLHYLTDANKEWINQNGRLTRLVLNDLERYVYKPSLNKVIESTQEYIVKTKCYSHDIQRDKNISPDQIVVLDTKETVVNFLHFRNEAHRQFSKLIIHALPFFEKTVLPKAEWIEYVLTNLISAKVFSEGENEYSQLKDILPPLFENELRSGIE